MGSSEFHVSLCSFSHLYIQETKKVSKRRPDSDVRSLGLSVGAAEAWRVRSHILLLTLNAALLQRPLCGLRHFHSSQQPAKLRRVFMGTNSFSARHTAEV